MFEGLKKDWKKKKKHRREYRETIGEVKRKEKLEQGKILAKSKMKIKREALEKQYKQKMNNPKRGMGGFTFNPERMQKGLSDSILGTRKKGSRI